MRCKACNRQLKQFEMNNPVPYGEDEHICSKCKRDTHDAVRGVPSRKVQEAQNSSGFMDVWA